MNRIYQLVLVMGLIIAVGCNTESESNKDKRNENWCWWVDEDSGNGRWIPIGNHSAVENGKYTLFYFNGSVCEKGTMKNQKHVDTTFSFDLLGICYGYKLNLSDTDRKYFYKDGPYKIYYDNGQLNWSGIVKNHRQGDQWKTFYKNGKLSSEGNLTNGVGYFTDYFENGKKKAIIYCDTSSPEDLYVQEWYENGQLAFTSELKNGRYDGVLKRYYENGRLKKMWEMKNGINDGPSKEYYENGQISGSCMVLEDVRQGDATVWYENGMIKATIHYKEDKMDGLQRGYYENGTLLCEANMKEGKPDGETRRYNALGKLESIELYSNGRRIK